MAQPVNPLSTPAAKPKTNWFYHHFSKSHWFMLYVKKWKPLKKQLKLHYFAQYESKEETAYCAKPFNKVFNMIPL